MNMRGGFVLAFSLLIFFGCSVHERSRQHIGDLQPVADSENTPGRTGLEILLHRRTTVRFASREEGCRILGSADEYVKAMSPFDMKLRMRTNEAVSEEAFLSFVANQVIEWNQSDIAHFTEAISIARRELELSGIRLDLPDTILLVKSTGREDLGSHTRQNAIIIPDLGTQRPSAESLAQGLLHELFHVMTRHVPQIRQRIYGIIGYRPCSEVKLPKFLLDRKVTNPDALNHDFFIEVTVNGMPAKVMHVLYSESTEYSGGDPHTYISSKLMAVRIADGICYPLLDADHPILYDTSDVSDLYEQIGWNTEYVIHPEEIMAENFSYMVMRESDVPNPEILDSMREILSE